ncbi:hypothetical protein [Sphingomicrobium arenosum]|uniref:hypothetical protein n=1 Tax=Sphingomicrobium arenosum TaxID=2233861 RepID=UPI00224021FD|nr:hypothetical protein [Sphingomicrobium arenosum]
MTLSSNLDEAFDLFEKLRHELDAAMTQAENEQREGRSGYDAVVEAQALSRDLNKMAPELIFMIEQARNKL